MTEQTERTVLLKKTMLLEYFTAGWNVLGAGVAIGAGIIAGSIALIGFGLNSILETVSVAMLLWRLHREQSGAGSGHERTAVERRILFVVGILFFLLGLYILNEAGSRLYYREKPSMSVVGIVLSALSLAIMPVLAVAKFRIAKTRESKAIRTDAFQTAVYAYFSFILVLGLVFNAWLGWWWADAAAVLLMLPLILRNGWEAIEASKGDSRYGALRAG